MMSTYWVTVVEELDRNAAVFCARVDLRPGPGAVGAEQAAAPARCGRRCDQYVVVLPWNTSPPLEQHLVGVCRDRISAWALAMVAKRRQPATARYYHPTHVPNC